MTRRIKYEVPFSRDGRRAVRVVELAEHERLDCLYALALRGPEGPGGLDGPIARGYAARRALSCVPDGFTEFDIGEEIRRRPQPELRIVR